MKKNKILTLALFLTLSASAVTFGTTTANAMEVTPKAAPAIAAALLKENGVKNNVSGVNDVSAIAKEMAQKADFMGKVKGGMDYECAVKHHLIHELNAIEMSEMCTMDME